MSALFQNHFLNTALARQRVYINFPLLITEMGQELPQFGSGITCITALMQAPQEHQTGFRTQPWTNWRISVINMLNIPTTSGNLALVGPFTPLGVQPVPSWVAGHASHVTQTPRQPSILSPLRLPDFQMNPSTSIHAVPHSAQRICLGKKTLSFLPWERFLSMQRLHLNCSAKTRIRQTPYLTIWTNKEQKKPLSHNILLNFNTCLLVENYQSFQNNQSTNYL